MKKEWNNLGREESCFFLVLLYHIPPNYRSYFNCSKNFQDERFSWNVRWAFSSSKQTLKKKSFNFCFEKFSWMRLTNFGRVTWKLKKLVSVDNWGCRIQNFFVVESLVLKIRKSQKRFFTRQFQKVFWVWQIYIMVLCVIYELEKVKREIFPHTFLFAGKYFDKKFFWFVGVGR